MPLLIYLYNNSSQAIISLEANTDKIKQRCILIEWAFSIKSQLQSE